MKFKAVCRLACFSEFHYSSITFNDSMIVIIYTFWVKVITCNKVKNCCLRYNFTSCSLKCELHFSNNRVIKRICAYQAKQRWCHLWFAQKHGTNDAHLSCFVVWQKFQVLLDHASASAYLVHSSGVGTAERLADNSDLISLLG